MTAPAAASPADAQTLFLAELRTIERAVHSLCERYHVDEDEAEEFASIVKLRLIEDDYAVIRKFRGRSSLATYLTVVVTNLFRDYRIRKWGKWRPSAAAQAVGAWAIRLEMLIARDGAPRLEAVRTVRGLYPDASDEVEMARFAAQITVRSNPRKPAGLMEEQLVGRERADANVRKEEAALARRRLLGVLEEALAMLPAEDQLILRLRYWDGQSIADIARTLDLPPKPLYRRIQSNLARLKVELEASGIDGTAVTATLDDVLAADLEEAYAD